RHLDSIHDASSCSQCMAPPRLPNSVNLQARYKLLSDHPDGFDAISVWIAPVREQHDAEFLCGYERHVRAEATSRAGLVEEVAAIPVLFVQTIGRLRFERHFPGVATKQPLARDGLRISLPAQALLHRPGTEVSALRHLHRPAHRRFKRARIDVPQHEAEDRKSV